MQIISDYYMVTVDSLYESSINEEGILTLSSAWVNNTTQERFEHKRIYGRVECCPEMFTDRQIDIVPPGYPEPKLHISGEHIQKRNNEGYHLDSRYYSAAGCDGHEIMTCASYARDVDIERFDRVYFFPMVTEPDNYLGPHNRQHLYKMRVDEIICAVRDGKIIMQGDWCLVEPEMETWESIRTETGIYTKPSPGASYLRAKMKHVRDLGAGIKANDKIIFTPGMNMDLKVEGRKYYAIQQSDILAKLQ